MLDCRPSLFEDRLAAGQDDMDEEPFLERDDSCGDGLELGLDDQRQGTPRLPNRLLVRSLA